MGGVLPISVSARVTALRSPKGALVATSRLALEVDAAEFLGLDQAVKEVPWRERVIEQNLFAASISVTLGFSFLPSVALRS
jgi:hypothetical protein